VSFREFENTNPMAGLAALRNEPNLAVADGLVKTNPTGDSSMRSQMPSGEFENTNPIAGLSRAAERTQSRGSPTVLQNKPSRRFRRPLVADAIGRA